MFAIISLSWASFTLLESSFSKSERISSANSNPLNDLNTETKLVGDKVLEKKSLVHLLAIQTYACALTNGILPSIQSYSCQPYGQLTYNLTVKLASVFSLTACFCAFYFKTKVNLKIITYAATFSIIFVIYIIYTAVLSPNPPLQDEILGKILILISWIVKGSLFSFIKASIASMLRDFAEEGHRALFWYGSFTQVGSATGAALMFTLINYTTIFKSYNPCSQSN